MCGRFALDKNTDDLILEFVAEGGDFADWRPGWNIRPTDQVAIVVEPARGEGRARRLESARWSLTPSWSKTLKMSVPTFNARSEGITGKPSFAAAIKSRRALVPASGYYEWHTDPETKKKTPYFIHSAGGELLAFAGIYSWWRDPSVAADDPTRWILTATILTADAMPALRPIHDRSPVPLPRDRWDDWLDPTIEGTQSFVDAAVAAALPVADSLCIRPIVAVTDDQPVRT